MNCLHDVLLLSTRCKASAESTGFYTHRVPYCLVIMSSSFSRLLNSLSPWTPPRRRFFKGILALEAFAVLKISDHGERPLSPALQRGKEPTATGFPCRGASGIDCASGADCSVPPTRPQPSAPDDNNDSAR